MSNGGRFRHSSVKNAHTGALPPCGSVLKSKPFSTAVNTNVFMRAMLSFKIRRRQFHAPVCIDL
jgi:hypothetical protein